MSIIKQYHRDTDTTYVYESESYWDPEKKQPRSRRRMIGKIDPQTGEIVPTGKRGRKPKDPTKIETAGVDQANSALQKQIDQAQERIKVLEGELSLQKMRIDTLETENMALRNLLNQAETLTKQLNLLLSKQPENE